MGVFDTMVTLPVVSLFDQAAFVSAARATGSQYLNIEDGRRLRMTMRSLIALRLWGDNSGVPIRNRCPTVEPWAIPSPWTEYRSVRQDGFGVVAPMASGLYFVSDRVPDRYEDGEGGATAAGRCGYALVIIPTADSPSVSVAMSDSSTWAPHVDGAGGWTVAVLETSATAGTVTRSGCNTTLYPLYWPPGVLVDPDPSHWLAGYAAADSLPRAAPALPMARFHQPDEVIPVTVASTIHTPQNSGRAGFPRLIRRFTAVDRPTYHPQFGYWVVPTASGLKRQTCGPDTRNAPMGDSAGAGMAFSEPKFGYPDDFDNPYVFMSSPYKIVVNGGHSVVTQTLSVYERDFGDTGAGTLIDTFSIPPGLFQTHIFTLSTAATLKARKEYYCQESGSGGFTISEAWWISNPYHALPFTVVASDGTVIPAGQATGFTQDVEPLESATVDVESSTVVTSRRAFRWEGLAAGVYEFPFSRFYNLDATAWASTGECLFIGSAGMMVIPEGGYIEAEVTAWSAPYVTMLLSTASPTPVVLAVGSNTVSGAAWPAGSYGIGQFVAPATGRYRVERVIRQLELVVGFDPAVSAPVARLGIGRRVTVPYALGLRNDPPTSASYLGRQTYLIGSAPTGDWVGHAGQIASAVVRPGTIAWQYEDPIPGSTWSTYWWDGSAWVSLDTVSRWVEVDLTAGQSLYVRLTPALIQAIPQGEVGGVITGPNYGGVPTAAPIVIAGPL